MCKSRVCIGLVRRRSRERGATSSKNQTRTETPRRLWLELGSRGQDSSAPVSLPVGSERWCCWLGAPVGWALVSPGPAVSERWWPRGLSLEGPINKSSRIQQGQWALEPRLGSSLSEMGVLGVVTCSARALGETGAVQAFAAGVVVRSLKCCLCNPGLLVS